MGADAAGRAGADGAAPSRTPYNLLRISTARPFKTPESSANTVDSSLPEAVSGRRSRRECGAAAMPKDGQNG